VPVTWDPDIDTTARLFRGLAHPVRLRVILALDAGPLSPSQLDERLNVGLSLVAYHVRALRDDGFLELVETRPARGSIESFYRPTARGRWARYVIVAARHGIADVRGRDGAPSMLSPSRASAADGKLATPKEPRVTGGREAGDSR